MRVLYSLLALCAVPALAGEATSGDYKVVTIKEIHRTPVASSDEASYHHEGSHNGHFGPDDTFFDDDDEEYDDDHNDEESNKNHHDGNNNDHGSGNHNGHGGNNNGHGSGNNNGHGSGSNNSHGRNNNGHNGSNNGHGGSHDGHQNGNKQGQNNNHYNHLDEHHGVDAHDRKYVKQHYDHKDPASPHESHNSGNGNNYGGEHYGGYNNEAAHKTYKTESPKPTRKPHHDDKEEHHKGGKEHGNKTSNACKNKSEECKPGAEAGSKSAENHKGHGHKEDNEDKDYKSDKLNDNALTEKVVLEKLAQFAEKIKHIAVITEKRLCSAHDVHCWKEIAKELYKLEHEFDCLDTKIDKSDLKKCFTSTQETKIANGYKLYAEVIIKLLVAIKHASKHSTGEVDMYILTAINSLRAAESSFTYELGRRIHSKESLRHIMEKQGALDGSTKGSINEAFALFIFTPLITGEDYKGETQVEHAHEEHKKPHHGEYKHHEEHKKPEEQHPHLKEHHHSHKKPFDDGQYRPEHHWPNPWPPADHKEEHHH